MPRLWPLLGLTLLLGACLGSGPARQDSYYRLPGPRGPLHAGRHLDGTLLVSSLGSRGLTDGRRIVFWEPERPWEPQRYTFHLWVEPPALLVQDHVIRALREARLAERVVDPSQRVRADYVLTGTVLRMEHRRAAGKASALVELELGLVRSRGHDLLLLKRYRVEEPARDEQLTSAVEAFGRALTRLEQTFLDDLARLP